MSELKEGETEKGEVDRRKKGGKNRKEGQMEG